MYFPFLRRYLIANSFLVKDGISCLISFLHTGILSVTNLCRLSQFLWVHMFFLPVMTGRYYFHRDIHNLWLLQSFWLFSCIDLWSLSGGVWRKHPNLDWVLQSLSVPDHYEVISCAKCGFLFVCFLLFGFFFCVCV